MKYLWFALIATIFTYLVTLLGAATVFFFKKINQKIMSLMFGFGAGVMIAAGVFSLILPGLELATELGQINYLIVGGGFLFGGCFILVIDLIISKLSKREKVKQQEGIKKNHLLLVLAITLHNIPEGLAIGVAFATALNGSSAALAASWLLALGIGLQNFPEGMAISAPLRSEGMSRFKSFLYGQASGLVEPISAVLGFILVMIVEPILPTVLGFAAGAMFYVVAEELIPEGKTNEESKECTIGVMIGFFIMMVLDVALTK